MFYQDPSPVRPTVQTQTIRVVMNITGTHLDCSCDAATGSQGHFCLINLEGYV